MDSQVTSTVLMIRPAAFGYNAETAGNNVFQHPSSDPAAWIQQKALAEFDHFVSVLQSEGIHVLVMEDTPQPVKPDAVFPNNWFSTHADGKIITYPMFASNRRHERRADMIQTLCDDYAHVTLIRLEEYEHQQWILEGTGSLVLDRENKIAYACLSERTSRQMVETWCALMSYTSCIFRASVSDTPIYHTNVMMAIGPGMNIICKEVIHPEDLPLVEKMLTSSRKSCLVISADQVNHFAGNMLAVRNRSGETVWIMSTNAFDSLHDMQREEIKHTGRIISIPIPVIESIGGGSVRCMLAEIFLERK